MHGRDGKRTCAVAFPTEYDQLSFWGVSILAFLPTKFQECFIWGAADFLSLGYLFISSGYLYSPNSKKAVFGVNGDLWYFPQFLKLIDLRSQKAKY
jgi:hypothetical protein